jgi:hypothetical protein
MTLDNATHLKADFKFGKQPPTITSSCVFYHSQITIGKTVCQIKQITMCLLWEVSAAITEVASEICPYFNEILHSFHHQ